MRTWTAGASPAAFAFILVALGCSAANEEGSGGAGTGAGSGHGGAGGGMFTTSSGSGSGGAGDCSEAAKLIYVLSDDNDMYSFRPDQKQFTLLGPLACATSMQPNSMAVDRDATAWVNYVNNSDTAGDIFKVSTSDLNCQPTSVSLTDGWYRLGMGFSVDVAGGTSETLFVAGTANGGGFSPGLGRIPAAGGPVTPVGSFTGALNGENAELTGTGDARLFGFFTTTPVQVAELDKTTGAIITATPLNGVETPFAWAFSFWGGDFYLYTAPDPVAYPNRTTNVTRYRPSDGSIDTAYMTNIGFRIVGAGVSTCAPLGPPPE